MRTTVALSGRAGAQRMRGTLIAGFEQPDALRLEGVAPFGPPAFILVARDGSATLLLPRDDRVVTGVSAADILEALAGVRLDPATLRTILAGCLSPAPDPVAGRSYANGWMAIDLRDGATAYLRRDQAQWRVVAGLLPGIAVQYDQFEGGLPRQVRIDSRAGAPSAGAGTSVEVSLALALSDLGTNITLNPAAFTVDVPPDAVAMTLAELREAGPLGVKGSGDRRGAVQ